MACEYLDSLDKLRLTVSVDFVERLDNFGNFFGPKWFQLLGCIIKVFKKDDKYEF